MQRLLSMPYALYIPLFPLLILCALGFLSFHVHYQTPEEIPYWTFLFGMPHIIASFQTALDSEYLRYYKKQVFVTLIICVLPFILVEFGVSGKLVLTVFFIMTVHHVIAQQFGIALAVEKMRPNIWSAICKWSTVLLGVVAYFKSYLGYDLQDSRYYEDLLSVTELITLPLLLAIIVSAGLVLATAKRRHMGGLFLLSNVVLFVFALVLIFKTPYALVGLMLVRILHDTSGFVIYILHDVARNRRTRKNVVYRSLPFVPVCVLNPLLALGMAWGLSSLAGFHYFVGWLIVGITLAHYYIEKFIWKSGSPHRQNFSLT